MWLGQIWRMTLTEIQIGFHIFAQRANVLHVGAAKRYPYFVKNSKQMDLTAGELIVEYHNGSRLNDLQQWRNDIVQVNRVNRGRLSWWHGQWIAAEYGHALEDETILLDKLLQLVLGQVRHSRRSAT